MKGSKQNHTSTRDTVTGQQTLVMRQTLPRPSSPHVEGGVRLAGGPQTEKASLSSTLVPVGFSLARTVDSSLLSGEVLPSRRAPPKQQLRLRS